MVWIFIAYLVAGVLVVGCKVPSASPIGGQDSQDASSLAAAKPEQPLPSLPRDCLFYQAAMEQSTLFASATGTYVVSNRTSVDRWLGGLAPEPEGLQAPASPRVAEYLGEQLEKRWQVIRDALPTLQESTIEAYFFQNLQSGDLAACQTIAQGVAVVDSAILQEIFENGWWPDFYERFPGSAGIVRFSRPGVSKDGHQALLNASRRWGGKAGRGVLLLFEAEGGRWSLVGQHTVWSS